MPHLIARNTGRGGRNEDVEAALRRAQAGSALNAHQELARDITKRVLAKRRLPAAMADAVAQAIRTALANEAALMLKPPGEVADRQTREAMLRGLIGEAEHLPAFCHALERMIGALIDTIDIPSPEPWGLLTLDVPAASRLVAAAKAIETLARAALRFAPDVRRDEPVLAVGFALAGDVMKKLLRASGLDEATARSKPHRLKWPEGVDAMRLVADYMAGTAFEELLTAPLTLQVGAAHALEHTAIIAASGTGKTVTLEAMICRHLEAPTRPGLVIIDSQGDLLKRVRRLAAVKERLVYVDASDVERPPQLSLFDLGLTRSANADARTREAIRNGVLELYEYLLGDLLLQDMTAKQLVPFRFLCALMMEIENATLIDLRTVLDNLEPYRDAVSRLPATGRRFFERDFLSPGFADSRKQLGWRLDGLLVRPSFERMFAARRSNLDLFTAMNNGEVVLVDTAKEALREEGSSLVGKYFIALTLAACLDRARIVEAERRPAYLIIDEAHEYLSGSVETLLRQARKYKVGVTLATQTIAGMKPVLRDTILGNTAIKIAAGLSERGGESLAAAMRTSADFIQGHTRSPSGVRFACHVRNLTREAVTLHIPFGVLDRMPQMSEREAARVLARSRERLAATDAPSLPPAPAGHDLSRPAATHRDTPGSDATNRWDTY